jgi:hypothetical protein
MLPRYPAKKYDVRTLRIAARRCIPIVCKHRPTRTMTARRNSPVGVRGCRACRPAQARRMAIQGKSTLVWARHGTARQDKTRQGTARHGTAQQERHGKARHGKARQGTARHGKARQGTACSLGTQSSWVTTCNYSAMQPCNTTYDCNHAIQHTFACSARQVRAKLAVSMAMAQSVKLECAASRAAPCMQHTTYNIQQRARPLASNRACALPHSASI